jgi:hypothetical protein
VIEEKSTSYAVSSAMACPERSCQERQALSHPRLDSGDHSRGGSAEENKKSSPPTPAGMTAFKKAMSPLNMELLSASAVERCS